MYEITSKERIADTLSKITVAAPLIAKKAKPGQFIMLRVAENGERIPLTIFAANPDKGEITLIFQKVGKTTLHLDTLEAGDSLQDLVGPLGKPTHIENFGHVVSISGGVGTAIGYPVTKGFKDAGNRVTAILGARTKDLLLLEDEMRDISDELIVTTDDGSSGTKGLVVDPLNAIIASGTPVDLVIAVGPLPMMRAVAEATRPLGIKTIVSLDSLMIDGTGMCGGCRVVVSGQTKFTCVDGPEFDAHEVDWDITRARKMIYRDEETTSKENFENHTCRAIQQ